MSNPVLPWAVLDASGSALSIFVDTNIYPLEVVFRTCYGFTDKCYLFLSTTDSPTTINVRFKQKSESGGIETVAGEFSNELISQKVRRDVANETKAIRELIVAQAFAEADLIDRSECNASYIDDPRGISITK
jgi:His-Xaa-Ser system protein HxsD